MRANFYVDGFNLYHRAVQGTRYKWLDLGKFCRFLLPEHQINRIRYFTAIVDSRPGDPGQQQRQQAYLRALGTVPGLSIHYGKFRTRVTRAPLASPPPGGSRTVEILRTDEKGSDVNLATYLLADGFRGDYEVAVVVSNDSDLIEPITVVRDELNLMVGVIITDSRTRRSALPADFHRRVRERTLKGCQFPATVRDARGTIRKPAEW